MNTSRVVRVISYFLFGLIFLFLILTFSLNYYINEKVGIRIKDKFSETTAFKYALSFDKVSINLFTQRISLSNIVITPISSNKSSSMQFLARANFFKVIDFSIFTYLRTKKLEINKIEIINPQVSFYLNDSVTSVQPIIKNDISNYINSLSINDIDVVNCNINVFRTIKDSTPFLESFKNSISFKNVSINFKEYHKDSLFRVEDIDVLLNNVKFYSSDSLYTLYGSQIHVSLSKSSILIDSLKLLPNYSKKIFADKVKFQTSRVSIVSSKVSFHHCDFQKLLRQQLFCVKKVEILSCLLGVYRDNTKALEPLNRPSIQSIIKNIPFLFTLDTIELKNGSIHFEALQPSASLLSKIFVDKVNLTVFNVCNDSLNFSNNKDLKVNFEGYVLGKAKFTEIYTFPMKAIGESFSCSGSLSSMPLSGFNSVIIPAKQIMFKDGQIDDVVFSFVAKENVSIGTMVFKYHDLEIKVFKKGNSKRGIKELFSTLVLNNIALNKSNPKADGEIITAKLFVKHNPYRYFLFYSMQTILSGVEPTIIKN